MKSDMKGETLKLRRLIKDVDEPLDVHKLVNSEHSKTF